MEYEKEEKLESDLEFNELMDSDKESAMKI